MRSRNNARPPAPGQRQQRDSTTEQQQRRPSLEPDQRIRTLSELTDDSFDPIGSIHSTDSNAHNRSEVTDDEGSNDADNNNIRLESPNEADILPSESNYFSPSSNTTEETDLTRKVDFSKKPPPPLLSEDFEIILQPSKKSAQVIHETIEPLQDPKDQAGLNVIANDLGGSGSVISGDSSKTPPIVPAHPFFSPSFYDDDASDAGTGSIVFKNQQKQEGTGFKGLPSPLPLKPKLSSGTSNTPTQQQQVIKRDRFPSFDSLGSSGSIRYVPPGSQLNHQQTSPTLVATAVSSSVAQRNTSSKINNSTSAEKPIIMPYHERLQQRKKRQKGEASSAAAGATRSSAQHSTLPQSERQHMLPSHSGSPKQEPPPQSRNSGDSFPYFYRQQQQQYPSAALLPQHHYPPSHHQNPHYPPQIQQTPPPPFHHLKGSPQQQHHVYHHSPPQPYRYPPQAQPYPHPQYQHQHQLYPPGAMSMPSQGVGYTAQPQPNAAMMYSPHHNVPPSYPQQQQWPNPHVNRSPSASTMSPNSQDHRHPQSSSQGHRPITSRQFSNSQPMPEPQGQEPPPPPPPPPPWNYFANFRDDSTTDSGSLSSLGSTDRSDKEGDEREEDEVPKRKKETRGKNVKAKVGFFERLLPRAPKKTEVPNVDNFHKKNQAFLNSSTVKRQNLLNNSPSPTQPIRRTPLGSMDRPPASRGTHKRLTSIDNDNWDEDENDDVEEDECADPDQFHSPEDFNVNDTSSRSMSLSDDDELDYEYNEPNEQTKLLPPAGISSNEHSETSFTKGNGRHHRRDRYMHESGSTVRMDNTTATVMAEYKVGKAKRKHKKKKNRQTYQSRIARQDSSSEDYSGYSSSSSSEGSSQGRKKWAQEQARMLEKERAFLLNKWREEARAEDERNRLAAEHNRLHRRIGRYLHSNFAWVEAFISNLPLTIGAISVAFATLGVDWFKFVEENLDSCKPVHFHSSQCTFPEFPGCFYCDTSVPMYKVAANFHQVCSGVAGILALSFLAKLILARRVVFDELSSPTTAAPAGLTCMTLNIVFAGRGLAGEIVVCIASAIHLCLATWFIYMAFAYHIMPEPSWFPNTVGIGISAVKTWLYFPTVGHFLMAISLSLNLFFFPISLARVFMNRKISATVGWMQMSAPNVSLYALTIMAQPSFEEEHPDVTQFQRMHRMIYLPCMHFLFGLCILGILASVVSLIVRWKDFSKVPFSPAHAAFCCPTLSHANAVQAYRGAINSFSEFPPGHPFMRGIYAYWLIIICGGTIVTLWIGTKFLLSLPTWTHIDIEGEIEPPAPNESSMAVSGMIATGETLVQDFVSPAILQANETGALVLARTQSGEQRFVRTRKVTALGFEPIMDAIQMETEREILLEYVAKHPPRRRHRTLSVPGVDFSYGANLGTGNSGIFDGLDPGSPFSRSRRLRANTTSPMIQSRSKYYS